MTREHKKHREIQDHIISKLEDLHDDPEALQDHFLDGAYNISLTVDSSGLIQEVTLHHNVSGGAAKIEVFHEIVTSTWHKQRSHSLTGNDKCEKALEELRERIKSLYVGVELK